MPDWQGRIDGLMVNSTERVEYDYIGLQVARRRYFPYVYSTVYITYNAAYDDLGRLIKGRATEN